jgi:hypothetical protein
MSGQHHNQHTSLNHNEAKDTQTMVNGNDTFTAPLKTSKRRAIKTDRELLKLCAAWRPAVDRCIAVMDRLAQKPDSAWTVADRARDKKASRAVHELEEAIFDTPAATLAGLKAKAEILRHMDTAMGVPAAEKYAASLVTDILALGRNW